MSSNKKPSSPFFESGFLFVCPPPQIEGNTYSLLDTEALLKEYKVAKGKTEEETQMILNHKKAFEFVIRNKQLMVF